MKKRELFKISPEAARLIQEYLDTQKADDSLYVNPTGKRERLRKAAQELETIICRVSEENPSFDAVDAAAEQIVLDCRRAETVPKFPKTKEQIYAEIVGKLTPLLEAELVGKAVCFKEGVSKFSYFRVDKVEVRVGMYKELETIISGRGFCTTRDSIDCNTNRKPDLPSFKFPWAGCSPELLLTGKTYTYSMDGREWLYVISDEEFNRQFAAAVSTIAKAVGVPGYGSEPVIQEPDEE